MSTEFIPNQQHMPEQSPNTSLEAHLEALSDYCGDGSPTVDELRQLNGLVLELGRNPYNVRDKSGTLVDADTVKTFRAVVNPENFMVPDDKDGDGIRRLAGLKSSAYFAMLPPEVRSGILKQADVWGVDKYQATKILANDARKQIERTEELKRWQARDWEGFTDPGITLPPENDEPAETPKPETEPVPPSAPKPTPETSRKPKAATRPAGPPRATGAESDESADQEIEALADKIKNALAETPTEAPKPKAKAKPEAPSTEPEVQERKVLRVTSARAEQAGSRHENGSQDTILQDDEHHVYGVFDGVGGGPHGDVASRVASKAVRESFSNAPKSLQAAERQMRDALRYARERVIEDGEGGSTTAVIAHIVEIDGENYVIIGNAGDSRAFAQYPKKSDYAKQNKTRLRELASEQYVQQGDKNFISNWLGESREGQVKDEVRSYNLKEIKHLMLCSDGITGDVTKNNYLTPEEIFDGFRASGAQAVADRFIEISRKDDDKSVVVLDFNYYPTTDPKTGEAKEIDSTLAENLLAAAERHAEQAKPDNSVDISAKPGRKGTGSVLELIRPAGWGITKEDWEQLSDGDKLSILASVAPQPEFTLTQPQPKRPEPDNNPLADFVGFEHRVSKNGQDRFYGFDEAGTYRQVKRADLEDAGHNLDDIKAVSASRTTTTGTPVPAPTPAPAPRPAHNDNLTPEQQRIEAYREILDKSDVYNEAWAMKDYIELAARRERTSWGGFRGQSKGAHLREWIQVKDKDEVRAVGGVDFVEETMGHNDKGLEVKVKFAVDEHGRKLMRDVLDSKDKDGQTQIQNHVTYGRATDKNVERARTNFERLRGLNTQASRELVDNAYTQDAYTQDEYLQLAQSSEKSTATFVINQIAATRTELATPRSQKVQKFYDWWARGNDQKFFSKANLKDKHTWAKIGVIAIPSAILGGIITPMAPAIGAGAALGLGVAKASGVGYAAHKIDRNAHATTVAEQQRQERLAAQLGEIDQAYTERREPAAEITNISRDATREEVKRNRKSDALAVGIGAVAAGAGFGLHEAVTAIVAGAHHVAAVPSAHSASPSLEQTNSSLVGNGPTQHTSATPHHSASASSHQTTPTHHPSAHKTGAMPKTDKSLIGDGPKLKMASGAVVHHTSSTPANAMPQGPMDMKMDSGATVHQINPSQTNPNLVGDGPKLGASSAHHAGSGHHLQAQGKQFYVEKGSGEIREIQEYAASRGHAISVGQASHIWNAAHAKFGDHVVNIDHTPHDVYHVTQPNGHVDTRLSQAGAAHWWSRQVEQFLDNEISKSTA